MADAATFDPPMTIEAFDAFLATVPEHVRYELVDGVAVMMANPTLAHGRIAMNLAATMHAAGVKRGCSAYVGSVAVQAANSWQQNDKYIPDISFHFGPVTSENYITNPLLVVEVLSPSTWHRDRGVKLDFYASLPSLRHIVLVYQDVMAVEHLARSEECAPWTLLELRQPVDVLDLTAIPCAIPLAAIYEGVPLALQARAPVPVTLWHDRHRRP